MIGNNQNCDVEQLRRYLAGELAVGDEDTLVRHLDDCSHCQREVEFLAASAAEWEDVRTVLGAPPAQEYSPSVAARPVVHVDETSDNDLAATGRRVDTRLDFLAPTDDPEMLGRLGPYEIKGLIGHGGMGLVLKAYDRALQRTVAIKVLAPHLATSAVARRRFAREAQAAAAVAHEHVIAIHAVAEAGGLPYLVMPYMPGQSLQQRLDEVGPLSMVEVLRIGSQIAAGLAAAHAQGLVHRDIKPANILLEQGIERVAITDFGLARAIDDVNLTRSGVLAGTPAYMSPEQARGETVDHRADLFSLGSVMYAMCAGRPPFRAESTIAVLKRICEAEPTPLVQLNPEVPPWLERVITRLHAKTPDDRFTSATEVAGLLQRCLAHMQNPAAVPLPIELEAPQSGRQRMSLTKPRLLVACLALVACVSAAFLWEPLRGLIVTTQPTSDIQRPNGSGESTAKAQRNTETIAPSNKPSLTEADYVALENDFKQGRIADPETLYQWSLRLLRTHQAHTPTTPEQSGLQEHLRRMRRLEALVAERGMSGWAPAAKYYRLEAEARLSGGDGNSGGE
jgi:serine/threonine-protein kinase